MDFHCHLDLYPDAREVYAKAQRETEFVWLVTTSPRAFIATSNILPATTGIVISPGMHPEIVDKKFGELDLLLGQLEGSSVVGEVGLDGSARYKTHFLLQKRIFAAVVERCQSLGGRVLSIHSRAAAAEVLSTLESNPGFGLAVLHWFTDSTPLLRRALAMGCWFSVGPAMLQTANGRKLVALMPPDRVVPESDGPFAKNGVDPIMPWQTHWIETRLSEIWGVPASAVAERLRNNGLRLIELMRLPGPK
jgi:TatD DNase family protein